MQEFTFAYLKGLTRGLRRFPISAPKEEWLSECHNLEPQETGVVGYVSLLPLNITTLTFDYLGIKDQAGTVWYWYLGRDGELYTTVDNSIPNVSPFDAVDITPGTIPYWVRMVDELGGFWYLSPDTIGSMDFSQTQPSVGTGINNPIFQATDGLNYMLIADSILGTFYPSQV